MEATKRGSIIRPWRWGGIARELAALDGHSSGTERSGLPERDCGKYAHAAERQLPMPGQAVLWAGAVVGEVTLASADIGALSPPPQLTLGWAAAGCSASVATR